MISDEQKELSGYIKAVHLSLRCKSRQVGAELAWKEHKENEEVLRNYAIRMKSLAEDYWSVNNLKDNEKCLCRIQWMVNAVEDYFQRGGLEKEIRKEQDKVMYFVEKGLLEESEREKLNDSPIPTFKEPYKLLDVGSCYNPFGAYDAFETFPIDLYPAVPEVKKCDFTQVQISGISLDGSGKWFRDDLELLPSCYFDIVVFSLYLEYLPSPELRFVSCQKAYEALKVNGLLLIITPDSNHESANAGIMKLWKLALARIGFARVKLEKLKYIYCMAYRKTISSEYPIVLYGIKEASAEAAIPIPQDFIDYNAFGNGKTSVNDADEENVRECFQELPFV